MAVLLKTRSAPTALPMPKISFFLIIGLATLAATYLSCVLVYFIIRCLRRKEEQRLHDAAAAIDPETRALAHSLSEKRRKIELILDALDDAQVVTEEKTSKSQAQDDTELYSELYSGLYSADVMRAKLFRRLYPGRPCSAYDRRRGIRFVSSPLRHLLFACDIASEPKPVPAETPTQPSSVFPLPPYLLRAKANVNNVQIVSASSESCKPPYNGLYRWGTVSYTLGKPLKSKGQKAQGTRHGAEKENQPIPSALLF